MKRVGILILLCSCFGWGQGQTTANITPASTGQKLGSVNQRWDAFIHNLDVSGTLTLSGPFTIPPTAFSQLLSSNNGWSGNQTFNGLTTFTGNNTHSGTETFTSYAISGTPGVTPSATASTSALGGTIQHAPGLYTYCGVTVSNALRIDGAGVPAWGSVNGNEPTQLRCDQAGQVMFHNVSASGNTVLNQFGMQADNIVVKDNTNGGAGGLATGAFFIDTTNHAQFHRVSCEDFSGSGAYCWKFSAVNPLDASYFLLDDVRIRNADIGVKLVGSESCGIITNGEIAANTTGIDADLNTITCRVYGPSIEVKTNGTGINYAGQQGELFPRAEATTGSTNTVGVNLASTASKTRVGGTYNKFTVGVHVSPGAAANEVDVSNSQSGATAIVPVHDEGDGTLVIQSNKQMLLNTFYGSTRDTLGWYAIRGAATTTNPEMILSSVGTGLTNSNKMSVVGATGLVRTSNVLAVTTERSTNFAAGNIVIIDGAPDTSFNSSASFTCTVLASPAPTATTFSCNTPTLADATSGYAMVKLAAPGAISAPSPDRVDVMSGGVGPSCASVTATGTQGIACLDVNAGNFQFKTQTSPTYGTQYATTQVASISPAGLGTFNGGVKVGTNGTTISTVITASATLTYTAIAGQTCQEQPVTVTNSLVANKGVTASPQAEIGANLMFGGARVSAAGTVQVRVCNPTAGSITPTAVAWGVTVTQ